MQQQNFFVKNRVILLGLLSSAALTVQQLLSQHTTDYKVLAFAAFTAMVSYIANQWRGKGVTLSGIIGTIAYAYISVQENGHFTWQSFLSACIVLLLAAVAPPPKADTYEHNEIIVQAKEIPPVLQVDDREIRTTPKTGVK